MPISNGVVRTKFDTICMRTSVSEHSVTTSQEKKSSNVPVAVTAPQAEIVLNLAWLRFPFRLHSDLWRAYARMPFTNLVRISFLQLPSLLKHDSLTGPKSEKPRGQS
jgi:hypothetical protein